MGVYEFQNIFLKLRLETGMTQGEMAKALNVSKSTIGMWETGKRLPSPELYEQLADYFNVDIDFLYGKTKIRQQIHYDADGNPQRTLSHEESLLFDIFQKLNDFGKSKALEYITDLSEQEKYTSPDFIRCGHSSA